MTKPTSTFTPSSPDPSSGLLPVVPDTAPEERADAVAASPARAGVALAPAATEPTPRSGAIRIGVLLSGASAPPEHVADVRDSLVAMLQVVGAEPVLLDSGLQPEAFALLETCQGMLITPVGRSGRDVDPAYYGGELTDDLNVTHPVQDHNDIVVIREAFERRVPVLGVAFGMQIGLVARSVQLVYHGDDHTGTVGPREVAMAVQRVHVSGGLMREAVGAGSLEVRCMHHCAPYLKGTAGQALTVTATSLGDNVPHAVESNDGLFYGVLWQLGADEAYASRVLRAFIDRCV